MSTGHGLTSLELVGATESLLTAAGYRPAEDSDGTTTSGRYYEDAYGIVAVFVFDTVKTLDRDWPNAQESLVSLISRFVARDQAKAWEGYLVLLTGDSADKEASARLEAVRRDTSRVRKLVGTADDVDSLAALGRFVAPLLPLGPSADGVAAETALGLLPELLSEHGIPRAAGDALVHAYESQDSLMRALQAVATEP